VLELGHWPTHDHSELNDAWTVDLLALPRSQLYNDHGAAWRQRRWSLRFQILDKRCNRWTPQLGRLEITVRARLHASSLVQLHTTWAGRELYGRHRRDFATSRLHLVAGNQTPGPIVVEP
jgi:hypothetical protein